MFFLILNYTLSYRFTFHQIVRKTFLTRHVQEFTIHDYSSIQKNALCFANTLDIPLATICNENPYNEEDKSLPEVGKLVGMSDQRSKKAYLSNRTSAIFTKFDYSDLPKVDQLIADFFVLDDMTREELFEYITLLKKNHSDPERVKILKEIKK
jgi:hypothetical protein